MADSTTNNSELKAQGLTVKEYLDSAAEASRRTRFVTVAMIVASVLVLVSVLNSWDQGWISLRLNALQRKKLYAVRQYPLLCNCDDTVDKGICAKLTPQDKEDVKGVIDNLTNIELQIANEPDENKKKALIDKKLSICKEEKDRLDTFTAAMIRSAAETKYTVHVPFFGVAFDINDVGILGGVGLGIVLILLRLSLRSQIVSLRVGFKKAFDCDEESDFYDILASRQVFTFPRLRHSAQKVVRMQGGVERIWRLFKQTPVSDQWQANRSSTLRFIPHLLSLMPTAIYSLQFYNDVHSMHYGIELDAPRTWLLLITEGLCLLFILVFGIWCITK